MIKLACEKDRLKALFEELNFLYYFFITILVMTQNNKIYSYVVVESLIIDC